MLDICRLHAWGDDLKEAFAQCAMAMYGYMTEIDSVEELDEQTIEVSGKVYICNNITGSRELCSRFIYQLKRRQTV